ncbi:HPt (histidine-containing phosphotransfer) domain-containing protein [Pontibacter ummariensis]|uniref:HPt (Histidine-containing phosphotransfer) domain-containing protein n=1 Tax=Pontibacter ummariensis TaxID=1610492 RepID=A0A239GH79_9BACT|nr:Hpt domain-containing protein [Pontibacter ummariensis]PRY11268.1 HPt (histidine-containing phosphotransfer) domain-containing protein [Pontibacter ummariensis]SNS68509.1 HPt (histidine-containing phosphotransfer) domain-containing protein [Pontibacter ummariensis]
MLEGTEQTHGITTKVNTAPLFKLDYLIKMSSGNKDFVKELINLFLQHVPLEMHRLERAITTGDLPEAKLIAHKLKSSTAMLGADSMTALLKQVEQLSVSTESSSELAPLHDQLRHIFEQTKKELTVLVATY